jgi:hypothetical protein
VEKGITELNEIDPCNSQFTELSKEIYILQNSNMEPRTIDHRISNFVRNRPFNMKNDIASCKIILLPSGIDSHNPSTAGFVFRAN